MFGMGWIMRYHLFTYHSIVVPLNGCAQYASVSLTAWGELVAVELGYTGVIDILPVLVRM